MFVHSVIVDKLYIVQDIIHYTFSLLLLIFMQIIDKAVSTVLGVLVVK